MDAACLAELNHQQRAAATFGDSPLLIIAGAGTGKTNTLAHRVAWLIAGGIHPSRILLLTFSRRASAELLKRVGTILSKLNGPRGSKQAAPTALTSRLWGGTFHAIAHRLLRIHGASLGLGENFTVTDRSDAEDLLNEVRGEIGLDAGDVRFPRKSTCLSIYSRCVNANEPVEQTLKFHFPWCQDYPEQLKTLFRAYTKKKQEQSILDYDDLLLYWFHLMDQEALAAEVRGRFDAVLVDEYQDTNAIQAGILKRLSPAGRGLTVVGDDAQSIYSFRAATVHNILDFPKAWPGAAVLKLEQNYRSVQPILDATNAVIALCPDRYNKDLFSERKSREKPKLVTLVDEDQQSDYVIRRCLAHLEAGVPLRKQAVLFRAAHHSDALEVELARRNIPFVKFGGLKFLEAAHVKDVMAILRLAENPRDSTSGLRVLQLIDGFGPSHARRAIAHLAGRRFDVRSWQTFAPPAAADGQWMPFVEMLMRLAPGHLPLPEQVAEVRRFYGPILERRYDHAASRTRDLEQLEQICSNFKTRASLLADLTLDPPSATQDLAGAPLREEDWLVLSTIHSAKGCEWDAVYVIHAADGNIPSDLATASEAEIEEERRLLYVALTRARDFLEVCVPLRYYQKKHATGDRHTYAQPSRFLPESLMEHFERVSLEPANRLEGRQGAISGVDVRQKIAAMWG